MQENLNNKKNEIIDFSNLKPQNNNDNYYNKSSIKNYIPFIISCLLSTDFGLSLLFVWIFEEFSAE